MSWHPCPLATRLQGKDGLLEELEEYFCSSISGTTVELWNAERRKARKHPRTFASSPSSASSNLPVAVHSPFSRLPLPLPRPRLSSPLLSLTVSLSLPLSFLSLSRNRILSLPLRLTLPLPSFPPIASLSSLLTHCSSPHRFSNAR